MDLLVGAGVPRQHAQTTVDAFDGPITARTAKKDERFLATSSHIVTAWAVAVPSALAVALLYVLAGALGMTAALAAVIALCWGLATLAFPHVHWMPPARLMLPT